MVQFTIQPLGDAALRVSFEDKVSPQLNNTIKSFSNLLKKSNIEGITEWVPAYKTITIYYKPEIIAYHSLREKLILISPHENHTKSSSKIITIPTWYGEPAGTDLTRVARHNNISPNEVIDTHSSRNYLIYMMGFLPGFPYLGKLSDKIATPRLKKPRSSVPAGSVGIADYQTGIYPFKSPGGWNIIGRTPVKLFDLSRETPFLFQQGDWVCFEPISKDEFDNIATKIKDNAYQVRQEIKEDE